MKDQFQSSSGKTHLYASLFGISDISPLKLRLFQNSFGTNEDAVDAVQKLGARIGGALMGLLGKVLPGGDKGAALVSGLGGLLQSTVVEATLKNRLIVLDDVERRNQSFQIGSVLGFIDEIKRNGCRVLVLFNEDPLTHEHADEWRALKEKCIDRELTLSTTSAEAAQIGLLKEVPYRNIVVDALEMAGVTNIRVVQRVGRVVSTIFDSRSASYPTLIRASRCLRSLC